MLQFKKTERGSRFQRFHQKNSSKYLAVVIIKIFLDPSKTLKIENSDKKTFRYYL